MLRYDTLIGRCCPAETPTPSSAESKLEKSTESLMNATNLWSYKIAIWQRFPYK